MAERFFPENTAPLRPIAFPRKSRLLSEAEVEKTHGAVLTLLGEVGVRFPLPQALDLFAEAGARVERDTGLVRISEGLLEAALRTAPKHFTLASRTGPARDAVLDGRRTYCSTDGTGINVFDLDALEIRASRKDDVALLAKIADSLDAVSFFWPPVSAQDVPGAVMSLHELEASVRNTSKHVELISCADGPQARWAAEIGKTLRSNEKERAARPPISILTCAVSPLTHDPGGLAAGLEFARAGFPVGLGTMPILGGTAPASIPALLAMGAAEILSAVVLFQLFRPGTPVFTAFFSSGLNPYTGSCLSSANFQALLNATSVDVMRRYGLPVMAMYGSGDSREPDTWAFARDNTIDAAFGYTMGPDMFACLGLCDHSTLCYPQQLILEDYVYATIKTLSDGLTVDRDSLAVDEIAAVGPGGSFMSRARTMKDSRALWKPSARHQWDAAQKGFTPVMDAALDTARRIRDHYAPEPLDEAVSVEISSIIRAAERELL